MPGARTKRNILIFHTGALGDFVLTWSVAMAVARMNPQSRVLYVTHSSKGLLASRFIGTESASIDSGGWHTLFSDQPRLDEAAAELLERTRAIFSFVSGKSDPFTQHLSQLAAEAEITCLTPLPPEDARQHITQFYQQQLPAALATTCQAMLKAITENGIATPQPTSGRILIHPGAGSMRKCWPLSRFIELGRLLGTAGHEVTYLLGEAELERIPAADLGGLDNVLRPETYSDLADQLLRSALLITNDNGPGHLAGVLGTRVLSLFGPTDPAIWRPLGPRAAVLHAPCLADLPAGEVADAAEQCLQIPLTARVVVED